MAEDHELAEQVAESARRIIIRLDIGVFTVSGPRDNIITVESQVAFSTTVNELYREGYQMVEPSQYAEIYSISLDDVYRKILSDGSMFMLLYDAGEYRREAVPLEEKNENDLGPHLSWHVVSFPKRSLVPKLQLGNQEISPLSFPR